MTNNPSELRGLLRHWRQARGISQFDLSLTSGISQKHISFIESGRSNPSPDTLITIAEALDIPLRDRNALLLAAGHAPAFPDYPWDSQEMASVTNALKRMLRQHEPFPAIVLDRYWDVLITNDCAPRFFGRFVDLASRKRPRNILHLMFDPSGLRPFVANWEAVARSLFERVSREAVGRILDQRTQRLIADLQAYPGVKEEWSRPPSATLPVVPLSFMLDGCPLNYFSMVTTVGTPQAIAAQELRIECMFPADDETETRHRSLFAPT
ncbi:helix-turn-helix domain-containing protein [Bradyrhizobium jicamae]|uniref:helix-turn-helix domain-containing protein n=1 Tax=Bradyrhizobium jicamae TaxID=280332 RepID=UPI003D9B4B0D